LEEDDLHLDEELMAMFTRKFKKFFKKAKENSKKKTFSKARNSDREQFTGCFKCLPHCQKLPFAEGRTGARTVLETRQKTGWKQFCKLVCKQFCKEVLKGNACGLG